MQSLRCSITRKPILGFPNLLSQKTGKQSEKEGHVRGIYALKRIIHTPKAHTRTGRPQPR